MLTILCRDDVFHINIDIEGETRIILHNFTLEEGEVMLFMYVFYSKNEALNKKIDDVLKILRKA